MKKLVVLALSALLVVAFTLPASALEAQFGGYHRTRFFTNQNFTGEDVTEAQDVSRVDFRTRLYYNAIFSENLKFVNKFEFNGVWGSGDLGDIGADGKDVQIKNSYVDFNVGPVNAKVGIQGMAMGSSFIMDDDFSGAVISFNGEMISIPFIWFKGYEGSNLGFIDDNDFDVDILGLNPKFTAGPVSINPFALYWYSDNAGKYLTGAEDECENPELNCDGTLETDSSGLFDDNADEVSLWYAGLTLEYDANPVWAWITGIYQFGDIDYRDGTSDDYNAFLIGGHVDVDFGSMFSIHGEGFYATGDDNADDDIEQFGVPKGASYYWAEIMGLGIFDSQASNNSPGDQISNIWAGNFGLTVKPMEKLTVALDGWYAELAEEDARGETYLGTEIDLVLTYQLVSGLNLDLVGAYLIAGEATTENDPNEEDPYEVGARLSLSF